jgi:1-phosphofructokinase
MDQGGRFVVAGLHPAIDRTVEVPALDGATVIRGRLLMVEAAGKGTNIVHTLSNFGHRVTATGFLSRWDRELFLSSFRRDRVRTRFILVDGPSRENVTVVDRRTGRDTHIIAGHLDVTRREVRRLLQVIPRLLRPDDWAVFAGGRPRGFRMDDFSDALAAARRRRARVCVDAGGNMLRVALRRHPWIIKPNRDELSELAGESLATKAQILKAATRLFRRCDRVLVSLGKEGGMLVGPEGAWEARDLRRVRVSHTVGCGDAFFAGFLAAASERMEWSECLRFSVACGSACVRSPYAALHSRAEAVRRLGGIQLTRLQGHPV